MFDWLRRNQGTPADEGVAPEQDLGNSLPTAESLSNGQTRPERGCAGTAGLVATNAVLASATAVPDPAWDGAVQGPRDRLHVAGGSGEGGEPTEPLEPPRDGLAPRDDSPRDESLPDESSGLIGSEAAPTPPLSGRGPAKRRGRRLVKPEEVERAPLTGEQRLWILDTWKRSGLPAGDFAPLVGVSKHTLYSWKKQFTAHGPAGLMEQKRGVRAGSRLPELTKRTILLLKEAHPKWGCERISAMLLRGPALPASAAAVARVLHEAGYQLEEVATRPHEDKVRHFERAKPNQLWQTDLFTFVLKRQNRRVYLVAFLDDHSRFIVSYGLHASQSTALVLEVLRAALACYGVPEEILTDKGAQYVTWRGTSQFTKELQKRGIRQIVAAPRRPQTLGKIERFWGSLWRECIETAVFVDLADAQARIGHFIDYYNFQRTHSGIGGLVPADRFFGAAPEVLRTLKERVASNACELARHGVPKPPFYMTGQVGGQSFSVHAEGERVILRRAGGARHEVELVAPETSPVAGDATSAGAAADTAASASPATASLEKSSSAHGERKRPRVARPGPALHANSSETKRLATAILEVLAGVRSPADAANTLEISLPRYYLLEQRALAGLLAACEPRSKGPPRSAEREITQLQRALTATHERTLSRCPRRPPLARRFEHPARRASVAISRC